MLDVFQLVISPAASSRGLPISLSHQQLKSSFYSDRYLKRKPKKLVEKRAEEESLVENHGRHSSAASLLSSIESPSPHFRASSHLQSPGFRIFPVFILRLSIPHPVCPPNCKIAWKARAFIRRRKWQQRNRTRRLRRRRWR